MKRSSYRRRPHSRLRAHLFTYDLDSNRESTSFFLPPVTALFTGTNLNSVRFISLTVYVEFVVGAELLVVIIVVLLVDGSAELGCY
jgi:hypothetical protein